MIEIDGRAGRLVADFSAWVCVNGIRAPVYQVKITDNKAVGFIESVEGATFSIVYRDDRFEPPVGVRVRSYVDGFLIESRIRAADQFSYITLPGSSVREAEVNYQQQSESLGRRLTFSKAALAEDVQTTEEDLKNFGQIRIDCHRATKLQSTEFKGSNIFPALEQKVINEKVKKASIGHQAAYIQIPSQQ